MYVEAKNVNKHFGDYHALDDVSFGIERGELVAYRRKGGKGAIVNVHDVDDWVRNTWPQVKGDFA